MIRKNFFIRDDQDDFIKQLPGNSSEHIRYALDMYIEKKRKEGIISSPSSSHVRTK